VLGKGTAERRLDQVRQPASTTSALAVSRDDTDILDDVLQWQRPLPLHYGGSIARARLAYRLTGPAAAPVVVALGGISAHRRVFDAREPRAGWWCELVGPGRALDSARLRILGIDYLGGSGDSSGPAAGERYPSLSSYDQADALHALLDHLRIERLRAFVGASYGGMVALAFAERYPARVEQLIVISAGDRAHPMSTAWRSVQRHIVQLALSQDQAAEGLQLARALAMATYRSPEEFAARFAQPPRLVGDRFVFPIEDYLFARGRDYASRYRAESFLCLSESIDLHAVDATRVPVPTTVVAVREDQLVPLADLRAMVARLPQGRIQELSSLHGHDAFLKEAGALQALFQPLYGEG
jgi:homoserine O-acetyltransferase